MRKFALVLSVFVLLCITIYVCFQDVVQYSASEKDSVICREMLLKEFEKIHMIQVKTENNSGISLEETYNVSTTTELIPNIGKPMPTTKEVVAYLSNLNINEAIDHSSVEEIKFFTNPVILDCKLGDYIVTIETDSIPSWIKKCFENHSCEIKIKAVLNHSLVVKRIIVDVAVQNENDIIYVTSILHLK